MNAIVGLVVGKVVEILLKYLIAWGEASIAKQKAIKKKLEEFEASKKQAQQKAEKYEQDPSSDNANNMP